jgi:transposase InsO family protein
MIFIIIDAHSKWIEAICTPNATSTAVIEELTIFAQFGIPETVVTDNGTFCQRVFFNNHLTSTPYHPASNGLAERAVHR